MMKDTNWFKPAYFAGFTFVFGVLAERSGWVPIPTEPLALGILAAPFLLGVGVVIWVLVDMAMRKQRRSKSKLQN